MQTERKKILLVGSCGFLLSNFLRKSLFNKENKYFFIGLDNLIKEHSYYNRYFHREHNFYLANVTDFHILKNIFKIEKPDIVIFGIADNSNIASKEKYQGILNIIELSKTYFIEKFIYLSSDKVYGVNVKSKEEDILEPIDLDSILDLAVEDLIKKSNLPNWNIVRISEVYGQRSGINNIVPKSLYGLLYNKNVFLSKQGLQEYDYIYIDDFCSGLLTIIEKGKENQIYNLSTGTSISEIEFIYEICKQINGDFSLVKFIETSCPSEFRQINSQKLQKLGWKPNLKWRQHLKDNIDWLMNNKWFFKLYDKNT